jgi:hypothetical protein
MSSAFVIEELRYDGISRRYEVAPGGKRFEWTTENRAKPLSGWPYELVVDTVRDNMPGASEPVEQVLGSHYEPFRLNGRWDDRYAGPGFAVRTCESLEELAASAAPVRVSWEHIVFIGILKSVKPTHRRTWLIDYDFEISPHRKGSDPGRSFDAAKAAPVRDYGQLVLQLAREMTTLHALAPTRYIAGSLHADVSILVAAVTTKAEQIGAVIDGRVLAFDDTVTNSLGKVVSDLEVLRQAAMAIPAALASAGTSTAIYFANTLIEAEFDAWSRGLGTQARSLAVLAREASDELARRVVPNAKALYRPRAGESLYDIAIMFFGTSTMWRAIAEANALYQLELDGTELLTIPSRV